ncbi:MAG: PorP/SprF family type IX secretion system membrane protein [Arcticibacter sp.]
MKRLSIIAALIFTLCQAMAQDIRYSQFFNNPLTFNPALTGSGIENLRATLSYRRQEAGPATPFATKGFAIDKSVGRFGLGFTVNSNGAGDASIKTLQLAGSLSYGVPFGYKGSNRITAGLQLGAINKSLNPSKLTFDNQFNEDLGYDPNISSGETFENTSIIRPALNMGFFWKRDGRKKDNIKPYLGYGVMNVNRPDVSFFGDDVRFPIKHVIHGGADIRINDGLVVKPNIYHFEQGPFNETGFGVLGAYRNNDHHEIQGGVFGKAGKAFVVYAGYQVDRFLVGMSYDVMTGQVREAGRGYGAFELSLTWTPRAKEKTPKPIEEKKKEQTRKEEPQKNETKKKEVAVVEKPKSIAVDTVSKTKIVVPAVIETKEPVAETTQQPTKEPTPIVEVTQPTTPAIAGEAKSETPVEVAVVVNEPRTAPIVNPAPVKTAVETPVVEPVKDVTIETTPAAAVVEQATKPVVEVPVVVTEKEAAAETTQVVPVVEQPTKTEAKSVEETMVNEEPVVAPTQTPAPSVFTPIVPNNKIVSPDSDGDGVNDFEDPCPFIKGSLATRGCPDSDEDGIVDMVDFCPLESGPKSNGGCPVKDVRNENDQHVVGYFDHVLFNTGSVSLSIDNTYDIIERAVEMLYLDKNTYVLISGHTDAEGDAASNMELSQLRANKVMDYFVRQGIKESRIKTIPYGENMPISGNSTESTRKLNRRVEITVLKRGH